MFHFYAKRAIVGALFSSLLLACGSEHAERNWCAVGGRGILVIVDRTTPFTELEQRQIRQSLESIRDGLGAGDRIQISSIENIFANSVTEDVGCYPKCAPGDGNCSGGVELVDQSNFNADLDDAIERVLAVQPEQTSSDVAATIAGASNAFAAEREITELYIFSDMIENSRHMPSERLFALPVEETLTITRENRALPNINGARVHVVGLGRGHQTGRDPITSEQMQRLREFWDAYFTEAAGRPPTYESVITR